MAKEKLDEKMETAKSLAATYTDGTELHIGNLKGFSIQLVWTGTPAGTFALVSSIDRTNFDAVPDATVVPAGSAGSGTIHWSPNHLKWIRINYTRTSGTGTLEAYIYGTDL